MDSERSKSPTDPLLLPQGDRVIIDNQIRALRDEVALRWAMRESEIEAFNRDRWIPFESKVEKRSDSANFRAGIAIGMSVVALVASIVRLILAAK